MDGLGKALMAAGAALFVVGGLIWAASRIGWFPLGRLPGDIVIRRNGFGFYFPIVTCLIVSVIGSLILWLVGALRR
ncbi:MAG TPA: DUF2905 domain-containing protein [Fimbriimonadaceae bacterium]|nr:DUF2905 domain-containing protein [Fimbriimonadaceae bacterium]